MEHADRDGLAAARPFARAMAAAALLLSGLGGAAAGDVEVANEESAVRALAAITAIQVRCRNLDVQPGYVFAFVESSGVRVADLLPGGRRRPDFDAAYAVVGLTSKQDLCSTVADGYAQNIPGSIGRR